MFRCVKMTDGQSLLVEVHQQFESEAAEMIYLSMMRQEDVNQLEVKHGGLSLLPTERNYPH